jgi:hypothetical protein
MNVAGLRRKEAVLSVMRALAKLKMGGSGGSREGGKVPVTDAHGNGVEFPPDVSIS